MLELLEGLKQGLGPNYDEFVTAASAVMILIGLTWLVFPFLVLGKLSALIRQQREIIAALLKK